MLLILKDPHSVHLIDDIKIEGGYLPTVGDFHPVWLQDGMPQIEPALWFKTDIITCVLLDVYQRLITWSTQPITEKQREFFQSCTSDDMTFAMEPLGSRSEMDADTIDLDSSYDEMFEAAEYLLKLQKQFQNVGSVSRRKRGSIPDKSVLDKIIIKLLHCYLLPCLKIKPVQLPLVKQCMTKQEEFIAKIDVDLERKMNEVARTKSALQIKRQTMVEQFQHFKQVLTYPKEILLILESQFHEDIRCSNLELANIQDEVNILKEENSEPVKLAEKRAERDEVLARQVKFIMARENIINAVALERPRLAPGKSCTTPSCYSREEGEFVVFDIGRHDVKAALGMYEKVYDVLQIEREERALLVAKKNLMISVREAIRETSIALEQGEVTTGSSNNKTRSRRATDVLNSSVPDQWLTLSEKVCECLTANSEHRSRHLRFVQQMKDKLAAAISVAKLAYRETTDTVMKLQRRQRSYYHVRREIQSTMMEAREGHREVKHEVATLLRSRANSCVKFRRRMDSIIQMSNDKQDEEDENEIIQEQIKNEIRLVQAQIHAHFDMMSSELQIALDEQSDVAYYKIWLCYEVHFYEEVIHDLVKIYHLSYRLICSNLKRNAAFVTFHDLAIQEKWLCDLLSQDNDVITENHDVVDFDLHLDKVGLKVPEGDDGVNVVELREHPRSISDANSSSSDSDLESLTSLVKRFSIYYESPTKGSLNSVSSDLTELTEMRSVWKTVDDPSFEDSDEVNEVKATEELNTKTSTSEESLGESLTNQDSGIGALTNQDSGIEALTNQDSGIEALTNQDPVIKTPTSVSHLVLETITNRKSIVYTSTIHHEVTIEASTNQKATLETSTNQEPASNPLTNPIQAEEMTTNQSQEVSTVSLKPPLLKTKNHTLPPFMKPSHVPRPAYRSAIFKEVFAVPMTTVYSILVEEAPLNKLQLMTKCVRQIQVAVSNFHDKLKKNDEGPEIIGDDQDSMMCCDDFLTILTLMLLHLDAKSLSNLYPHVVMLTDMIAPFLSNGLHSNSLTHFYGAYQIIFSTMVVKNAISARML